MRPKATQVVNTRSCSHTRETYGYPFRTSSTPNGEELMVHPSQLSNHAAIKVVGADDIVANEREKSTRRQQFLAEVEGEIRHREAEITALRDKRHEARMALCARLGDFGFAYDADSHSITRLSLLSPPEPEAVAPPAPTPIEPFDPTKYGVADPEKHDKSSRLLRGLDVVAWIAVPFLGAFVGYSVGLLAGLPVKASMPVAALSMAFGFALLAGMKASIYSTMYVTSRRAVATGTRGWTVAALVACVLLIAAEAGLGSVAIVRYSQDRALRPEEVLPWGAALLIALCFSTPVLITSLAKGAFDGSSYDDRVGRARREAERYHQEQIEFKRRHEDDLRSRDQAARKRREEALASFQEADEKYRSDDRWKSAMSLYGAIGALDREVIDREKLLAEFRARHFASEEVHVS